MTSKSTLLLEHHLKELRLPTFQKEYRKLAIRCAAEGTDHPDYLLRLAELELIDRHQRMVERRIRAARFPAVKSLDTFDFLAIPSVNKQLVMEARDDRRLLNLRRQPARLRLLIIDELGFVPRSTTGAELRFEVFSQHYERGSIRVITNLPFDEWTDVFGSERLTGALLDRLTHQVHILEMNGDSYRLKGSRQNTGSPSPDQPAAA